MRLDLLCKIAGLQPPPAPAPSVAPRPQATQTQQAPRAPQAPVAKMPPAALSMKPDDVAARFNRAVNLAVPFILESEGYRRKAYWDKAGKVWTVGHGHTQIRDPKTGKMRPVQQGDILDEAASKALTTQRVRENAARLYRDLGWTHTLSPNALAAVFDVGYNLGVGRLYPGKGNSPNLNRQMWLPGADRDAIVRKELPTYVYAGGKKIQGIVNRRRRAIDRFFPGMPAST